ncbi:glycosyltransferase family 4 protein [Bacillus thuringiensis]|uniref:glycosyltransferase family 4 protein n=1 Tax=Bacillus thuringiensis TaxID=1428 RepID=UPI000BF981EC|nr:glycosyltransferase family 4 protein [Bacillus thuringiensis]PFR37899.1 hypothetical protein COK27_21600 [Bacillus thuringiensis]PGL16714.1 hypothetical protein CN921_29135 [Bacillus thuringiensis]
MKICFLAPNYYPVIGGAETYLHTVIEGLRKKGLEIIVLTNGVGVNAPTQENFNGIEIYRLKSYWERMNDPTKVRWQEMYFSLLNEAKPILDAHKIDILHANSLDAAIWGSMLSLSLKVPLICSFHEHAPESEAFGDGKCEFIFSHLPVENYIAGSNFYYEKALKFGADKAKLKLIYHGIDLTKFNIEYTSSLRTKMCIPPDVPLIVCGARLKERKGLLELIRSMPKIREKINNIKLIIAGTRSSASDAYAEALYREVNLLNLEDVVTIDENLTILDMPDLYASADIVAQPSYEEGLGLSILEAMAMGKPIVSTNVCGVKEILTHEENGWMVEPKTIDPISEAILFLLENDKISENLGYNAHNMVKEKFSIDRMIEETIAVYFSVINKQNDLSGLIEGDVNN